MRLSTPSIANIIGMVLSVSTVVCCADPLNVDLPIVPLPEGAKGQWVAQRMAMNGLPMSVRAFAYLGKERSLIDFYKRYCRQQGATHVSNDGSARGRVIGCKLKTGEYLSISIEPANKKTMLGERQATFEGKVTVSAPAPGDSQPDMFTRFPMLIGSKVVSKVESIDAGQRVQTLVYENNNSVRANVKFIRKKLSRAGWIPEHANVPSSNIKSTQMTFEKPGELVQVTVKPGNLGGKTSVLVHWLK